MNATRLARLQTLFEAALEQPATARASYIADAARDDVGLAEELRELLDAYAATGRLDRLAASLARNASRTVGPQEPPPSRIGPWSLVSLLGQGGMGSVYLAERADGAYERRVALKLMRRDLIEPDERRRFLAERQILARIAHPCIAAFIDGDVTDEGRPWFVMEYIDGRPITEWCDAQQLDIAGRIALFIRVCDAVQHAHGALVVHRDLKPSNLLVTATGTPKLLDFGIAKVLDSTAFGDATPRTRTELHRLTPEYGSPEQLRGEPVTTASDVFQLGLLLFELLAGCRPGRRDTAGERRGETTERASTAVDASTNAASIAQRRATTVERLRRQLRGDIDTILQAALHSEPDRRYASAGQFAEDLRRYTSGLPVRARPDSFRYRTAKFVGRHRIGVATAVVAFVAAIGVAVAMTLQANRVANERDRAERVSELMADLFRSSDPVVAQGRAVTVAEVMESGEARIRAGLAGEPGMLADLLSTIGGVHRGLGDYPRALALEREAWELMRHARRPTDPRLADQVRRIAVLHVELGALDSAVARAREAVDMLRARTGSRDLLFAGALSDLGYALQNRGEFAPADSAYAEAEAMLRPRDGAARTRLAVVLNNRGRVAQELGDLETAETRMRESLALRRQLAAEGDGDAGLRSILGSLGHVLTRTGRLDEAEALVRERLDIVRRIHSPPHPQISGALAEHAAILASRGEVDRAEQLYREALAMEEEMPGGDGPNPEILNEFGLHLLNAGRPGDAEPLLAAAVASYTRRLGADHASTAVVAASHARALQGLGRHAEAGPILRHALEAQEAAWGGDDARLALTLFDLGVNHAATRQFAEVERALGRVLELLVDRHDSDPLVIRSHTILGEVLAIAERYEEAEAHFLTAHRALLPRGIDDVYLANNIRLLVAFYTRWGQADEAALYGAMLNAPE